VVALACPNHGSLPACAALNFTNFTGDRTQIGKLFITATIVNFAVPPQEVVLDSVENKGHAVGTQTRWATKRTEG
jgi:hypothetical protein